MSSEWCEVTLENAPLKIIDGDRGANYPKQNDFMAEGHCLFLNAGNVTKNGFSFEDCSFISSEKDAALRKGKLIREDVVLTTRGTVGNVAHFSQKIPYENVRINSGMVVLRPDQSRVLPKFLYFFLRSDTFKKQVMALKSGSAQPQLPIRDMNRIVMPIPSTLTQNEIVSILSSLDDRITLLRETNATLEAIAQAIFKSWFVDFDPVKAKQQGLIPEGMNEETVALFPDSFEESELGIIPRGWTPVRLDTFIELAYGKALKAENRIQGDVPVYGSGGITGWHNNALVAQPSIIVGRKGTVGSVYWESRPFYPIDTVFYLRARKPLSYCHQLLLRLGLHDMNTDAAVPGLNRENVYRLLVPDAPDQILTKFDDVMTSLRAKIDLNLGQAQILADLRDTLLPRLISGKLRIPEAESIVSEAL